MTTDSREPRERRIPKDVITSFRIDYQLWKQARIYALENDLSIKELIEGLIKIELEEKRMKRTQKDNKD